MTDQEKIVKLELEIINLREQIELLNELSEKRRNNITKLLNLIDKLESRISLGDA